MSVSKVEWVWNSYDDDYDPSAKGWFELDLGVMHVQLLAHPAIEGAVYPVTVWSVEIMESTDNDSLISKAQQARRFKELEEAKRWATKWARGLLHKAHRALQVGEKTTPEQ